MRKMKTVLLCSAIGLALAAAGCGEKNKGGAVPSEQPVSAAASLTPSPSPAAASPVASQEKEERVQAYFGNADVTGLVMKEAVIRYSGEEDKYLAALNALKTSPGDDVFSLCPHTDFLSAKLASGKLTVDLSLPDEDRLGASGEGLLLDALRQTLFQFDEVNSFEILVKGKKVESLMGHYDLPPVFTR